MLCKEIKDCQSHEEIWTTIEAMIPEDLMEKHCGYSYEEMAEIPAFSDWREELLEAEARWFELEN